MMVNQLLENEGQRIRIAERAYELYLQDGCEHGNDLDHWFRAEQEIIEDIEVEEPYEQPEGRKGGQRATRTK